MNVRALFGLVLFLLSIFTVSLISVNTSAASGLTVISPYPGEVFHYGQKLIVTIMTLPNATITIYVYNPNGTSIPVAVGLANASGYFSQEIWVWGSYSYNSLIGEYKVEIDVNAGEYAKTIPVYYLPFEGTIDVTVLSAETNLPLAGATVYVYNVTAGVHQLVNETTTNVDGLAVIHVVAFNFTQEFEVVASYPGYFNASKVVSITANQTVPVTLSLYLAKLNVLVVGGYANGKLIAPYNNITGYQSIPAVEGTEVTLVAEVEFGNMKLSNATLTAEIITPVNVTTITASVISSGMFAGDYNITFYAPIIYNNSEPYIVTVELTANYQTYSITTVVGVYVQANTTAIFQHFESELTQLNNEIKNLSTTLTSLEKEINNLTTTVANLSTSLRNVGNTVTTLESNITTLKNEISTLSTTVNNLNSNVSALNSGLASLKATVSGINSKISSLTPLVYAGLIAGIIGLIVAIVAIILVYRKIS